MAFIRTRKVKYDENGKIISGSAAIIDVKYVPGDQKYHSKQEVREKLGKIIELYSKKRGLFLSPVRGLIIYDAELDQFSDALNQDQLRESSDSEEVIDRLFPPVDVHTVFGDAYLLMEAMRITGITDVLLSAFPQRVTFERMLAHILHGILKDGSKISCEDFIRKSFASYCLTNIPLESLKSDTAFFSAMGEDSAKMAFFTKYVEFVRKDNPSFGSACFVDSTPLPNDIDSPFNALCSHGLTSTSIQMRLVLILDEATLLPIWYDIIPGNVLDINTLKTITKDVEISLGIHLNGFFLDAGYASRELVKNFALQKEDEPIPEKKYLVRMPAKKGYPYKKLYTEKKPDFTKARYDFVRKNHSYFGESAQVEIFDTQVMAYVYVDQYNALKGYTEYLIKHGDEFDRLTNREKDWLKVKYGYFVLISNYRKTPSEILDDYFERTSIETTFKTDKEYLKLLPLCKWSDTTVRGKILSDIIDSIVRYFLYRLTKGASWSISSMIGRCQSLMCFRDSKENKVYIETPNRQVKECYKQCGIVIPEELDMAPYLKQLFGETE